jgi:hypothetical protein
METCIFCGKKLHLIYSEEKQCSVHAQCIVERLRTGNSLALALAKEFDMVSDSSECTVGCD